MVRIALNQASRSVKTHKLYISTASKPDPISNIRVVRYQVDPRQSLARCRLESRRLAATKLWNEFWTNHNRQYNQKLKTLQESFAEQDIPSEQMDIFYANHLAEHRDSHREFNRWWIKENFSLMLASTKCWFSESFRDIREPGFFGGH